MTGGSGFVEAIRRMFPHARVELGWDDRVRVMFTCDEFSVALDPQGELRKLLPRVPVERRRRLHWGRQLKRGKPFRWMPVRWA